MDCRDTASGEPPSKKQKLSLSEAAALFRSSEVETHGQPHKTSDKTGLSCRKTAAPREVKAGKKNCKKGGKNESGKQVVLDRRKKISEDLDDELTQIESSLPHYLGHIFIGEAPSHSGSCNANSFSKASSQLYTQPEDSTCSSPKSCESQLSPLLFDASSPISPVNKLTCRGHTVEPQTTNTGKTAVGMGVRSSSKSGSNISNPLPESDTGDTGSAWDMRTNLTSCEQQSNASKSCGSWGEYLCPPSCTILSECSQCGRSVNLFAVVLQVNPLMEVACRGGSMFGQTVQMSSLLLGDPTKAYFKLTLWREASTWIERIAAGDIVYFTNIRLKQWRKEIVGHTIMHSTVLNLHLPKKELPVKVRKTIPSQSLEGLKQWVLQRHAYLFNNPASSSRVLVSFKTSHELDCDKVLVHFRAKLLAVISNRAVVIADEPQREVFLYLLTGEASLWHAQLSAGIGEVWEFQYLSVALEATQGCCSLQTTANSRLRILSRDNEMACEVLKKFQSEGDSYRIKRCTVKELFTSRESGVFDCRAKAVSFEFIHGGGSRIASFHSSSDDLSALDVVRNLCQSVYIGCETCSSLLHQDENGVYCQCPTCMARAPGGYPTSQYYFRPLVITLKDESGCMQVTALHAVVQKLLGAVTARDVYKASLAEDYSMCEQIKESVQHFHQLSTIDCSMWSVCCCFTKDSFSFVESYGLCLLDWRAE